MAPGRPRHTPYPPEFRARAVELARTSSLTPREVARDLGVDRDTIVRWQPAPDGLFIPHRVHGVIGRRCGRIDANCMSIRPASEVLAMIAPDSRPRPRQLRAVPPRHDTRGNLPPVPTPLVGREAELGALAALFTNDTTRLVTLTGATGIGKTRLALGLAERLHAATQYDLWFVDCESLDRADALLAALVATVAPAKRRGQPSFRRLAEALAAPPAVLILDRVDRTAGAAELVAELLDACPALRIVATGLVPLALRWEQRYVVPPLAYPSPRELRRNDWLAGPIPPAVTLYAARARAANPAFALTAANGPAVATLCARLDGSPLAIEIAAARANLLSPQALLAQPAGWLLDLVWDARDLPPPHRSLGAALARDCEELAPEGRALLGALATFASGMEADAVAAVLGHDTDETATLARLCALAERDLLRVDDPGAERPRFRMPGLVRDYALARLCRPGDAARSARRHALYYLALAERADVGMLGPERGAWLRRLAAEMDNLRAALAWAEGRGEAALALRFAASLGHFWWTRGLLDEGRACLERALAHVDAGPPEVRAKALTECTIPLMWQGDYARARLCSVEALALGRAVGDGRRIAEALVYLGWLDDATGDADRALERYAEALDEAERGRDHWAAGLVLMNLGGLRLRRGEFDEAGRSLDAGLAHCRQSGDTRIAAVTLNSLARLERERGNFGVALARLAEALPLCRESGDLRATYFTAATAATLLVTRGDARHALPLLTALEERGEPDVAARLAVAEHTPRSAFTATRRAFAASPIAAMWSEGAGQPVHQLLEGVLDALAEPADAADTAPATPLALSEREREVLRLVAAGLPNKQIAHMLGLAERTVKARLTAAMGRLGAENRAQAAVLAIQRQLL